MLRFGFLCVLVVTGMIPLSAADNPVRDLQRLLGRMQAEQADQRAALLDQVLALHPAAPPEDLVARYLRARHSAMTRVQRAMAKPARALAGSAASQLEGLRSAALAAIRDGAYNQAAVDTAVGAVRAVWQGASQGLPATAFDGLADSIASVDEVDAALARWPNLDAPTPLGGQQGVRRELDRMIRVALAPSGAAGVIAHNDACQYLDTAEREHLRILNDYRGMLGLPLLASDVSLYAAAKMHSIEMRTRGFFSHDSPVPGHRAFTDRALLHGTTASGENIQVGTTDGAVAFERWYHSGGHHRNMVGNFSHIGAARSEGHWTQVFGKGGERPGAPARGVAALRRGLLAAVPGDDWQARLQRIGEAAQANIYWIPAWELARLRDRFAADADASAAISRVGSQLGLP